MECTCTRYVYLIDFLINFYFSLQKKFEKNKIAKKAIEKKL